MKLSKCEVFMLVIVMIVIAISCFMMITKTNFVEEERVRKTESSLANLKQMKADYYNPENEYEDMKKV